MLLLEFLRILSECPLIASVQASPGSALNDSESLLKLAQASLSEGVRILRLEGIDTIRHVQSQTEAPIIGLIKRSYPGSDIYITPTMTEVEALIETGCQVVAIDGTSRTRPGGIALPGLIKRIHEAGRLAMADCDSLESSVYATQSGADMIGTTLAGYTGSSYPVIGPNLDLVAKIARIPSMVVIAEGRFAEAWQVRAAMQIGAIGVTMGGAINDPVKQTRKFVAAARTPANTVGAIDIGGTWLRAGRVTAEGRITDQTRVPLPPTRSERSDWINAWLREHHIQEVGIGAGGTIHPVTGEVLFSKPIIPDHIGTVFTQEIQAERVVALNDGHATAWGHALHPQFAGRRVATLALGTGVGFGIVDCGQLLMGRNGEHSRINDTPTHGGRIFEDLLGGAGLTASPSVNQIRDANEAAISAVRLINTLYYPDAIIIAGGVGLQPWIDRDAIRQAGATDVEWSPYGPDAGLIGAGFLALFPIEW